MTSDNILSIIDSYMNKLKNLTQIKIEIFKK
jgi:hypothetical protein